LIDVQEKLFPLIDRSDEIARVMWKGIKAAQILELPFLVTEQYPQGLGRTIPYLKQELGSDQPIYEKTSFSAYHGELVKTFDAEQVSTWILIGIEAHVCVLQTAKDLVSAGKRVVVLADGTSSRSLFDFSTALAEMRDFGVRISCLESALFELLGDATNPLFKSVSQLIKHP